jgi:hypothetical protein
MFYQGANEAYEGAYTDSLTDAQWRTEAVGQYAAVYGAERRDAAWILSPFDTWERNPSYNGPAQPHPEDDADAIPYFLSFREVMDYADDAARREGRAVKVRRFGDGWMVG